MPEPWDTHQGELHTGSGTNLRERSVLQLTKLEEWSHLTPLPSELQYWEFALLGFGPAFLQFGVTMCILCYYMLEV